MAETQTSTRLEAATDRQRLLKATVAATSKEAARLWRRVDRRAIKATWAQQVPRLSTVVMGGQLLAGDTANAYVAATLAEQGIDHDQDGQIYPSGLVGIASDGRPLESLLLQPASTAVASLAEGEAVAAAMSRGLAALLMIAATQIEDAFRAAGIVAGATRGVQMYARVLTPPSCSRCAILAGSVSSWQTAFNRHPRCDCIQVPTNSAQGRSLVTDPREYFESLSRAEQEKVFTIAGAQAIREGADIGRVVNARRRAAGMSSAAGQRGRLRTVNVAGEQRFVTFEGNAIQLPGGGSAPRLMPESIFAIAQDRDHAIRLLRMHGYIY